MATKSLVSATATLGIERRGQGREDPGIPGCHPRSRPRVPRLLPPPLAAASARETRRSGAEERGEEQGDPHPSRHLPSPPPAPPAAPAPPTSRAAPERRLRIGSSPPDAPFPPALEVSGNRGRSGYPESSPTPQTPTPPPGCEGLTRGAAGGAPRASGERVLLAERVAPHTEPSRTSGGERRSSRTAGGEGGERRSGEEPSSSARRLRARVSAHGRAALLPPPPPALRPSPPPAARRALHSPARRPPSFVATTSAGRSARAGALGLSARVSGSAVRLRLRAVMDVVRGQGGFVGERVGPRGSWDGVCPLSIHPPGARGGSTPIPVSLRPHIPLEAAVGSRRRDRHSCSWPRPRVTSAL